MCYVKVLPKHVTDNDLFDFDFFDFLITCYVNVLPKHVTNNDLFDFFDFY